MLYVIESQKSSYKLIFKNILLKSYKRRKIWRKIIIYEVTQNSWFMKIDVIDTENQVWECIQNLLLFL